MGERAINERMQARGTRTGQYGGASAMATFGDTPAEFNALRTGCGLYSLTWRKKLAIRGEDRVRWLNGMVTNNIRDLAPGHGLYCFFLNPQGRIQADLCCYNLGDSLMVDTDASQIDSLRAAFDKYIIMDDVELADFDRKTAGVTGPRAPEVVASVFPEVRAAELAPLEFRSLTWQDAALTLVRGDAVLPSFQIWCDGPTVPEVWKALAAASAKPVGTDALEMIRIWSGRPRFGQDIRERDLPQETGEARALHFNKGCYLGQEIVERIHARGNVHRVFTGIAFTDGPPPAGSKIELAGKEVGEVTSVATIPGDEGPPLVGLGYVRREAAAPGTAVQVAGVPGRIVKPPFLYVAAQS